MNLQKLFELQRQLDAHIEKEHPRQLGEDRLAKKILALQVELGELANEARFFKYWSHDQAPRIGIPSVHYDENLGHDVVEYVGPNPLLEEYVDCLSFFLSLANSKGWQEALWIYEEQLDPSNEFDGGLTGIFLEMLYFLNKSCMERHPSDEKIAGFQTNEYFFRMAWILFLNIGINSFGFTFKQIEEAYMKKNAVNHERQNVGY